MSTSATQEWTVVEMPVPASVDAPDAWALHGAVAVGNASTRDTWGTDDHARGAAEVLAVIRHTAPFERRVRIVAVRQHDGSPTPADVLGCALVQLPVVDNTANAWVYVEVHPEHRGRGIGSALFDAAVARARAEGRTTIQASTDQASEPAPGPGTLAPSTGTGLVRVDDVAVRFARARGFSLEQVDRYSVLPVPIDPDELAAHRAHAEAAAGDEYRVVQWHSQCPDRWLESYAHLISRMSTDAPMGGLDLEEEVWSTDRVREYEQMNLERGMTSRVTAAEHVPTGTLAAYTELDDSAVSAEYVHQGDTLVLREHRGRRLGMLVKAANLQLLAAERPEVRRIGTWNAEENEHMLAINVALGFRPSGGSGEWQQRL